MKFAFLELVQRRRLVFCHGKSIFHFVRIDGFIYYHPMRHSPFILLITSDRYKCNTLDIHVFENELFHF